MHYKVPNNASPFFLSDEDIANGGEQYLPAGFIAISDVEAEEMRLASLPTISAQAVAQAKITELEQAQLLPRITREFMLLQFATVAQSQGIDPMTNIAYAKLKAFDDQITALRSQL